MNDFGQSLDQRLTTPEWGVPQYEAPIDEEEDDE